MTGAPRQHIRSWHRSCAYDLLSTSTSRNLAMSTCVLRSVRLNMVMIVLSARGAQRLARLQVDFTAGVSHELRTPLAVIRIAAYT